MYLCVMIALRPWLLLEYTTLCQCWVVCSNNDLANDARRIARQPLLGTMYFTGRMDKATKRDEYEEGLEVD